MKPILIAEIGSSHNNSVERLVELVEKCVSIGVPHVKLQFRPPGYTNPDLESDLLNAASKVKGVKLGWTFYRTEDIPATRHLRPAFLKISSYELNHMDLVREVVQYGGRHGAPVLLSTGLVLQEELHSLINRLHSYEWCGETFGANVTIMHCVSCYPVPVRHAGLGRLRLLLDRLLFNSVGYSDHTGSELAVVAAVILSNFRLKFVELHVDLDDMQGKESGLGHVFSVSRLELLSGMLEEVWVASCRDTPDEIREPERAFRWNPKTGKRGETGETEETAGAPQETGV